MLFAESTSEWIIGVLGSGGVVAALMTLYFNFREKKRAARVADGKADREARREELEIDSEEAKFIGDLRQREIDDLRLDNTRLREALTTLQDGIAKRLIAANEAAHEWEKKYVALEIKLQNAERHVAELEARVKSLEGRT